jgi:DNA invertase Pin-like site-specific DNA recombinase
MKRVTARTTIRCVLYLRISLDLTGEGLAIERQRQDCARIALERGWITVREYVDESISAFKRSKKRPGYDQMVADYKAGLFDAIVVWDLDRLTRQPRQLEDWIEAAEERSLKLVTANGEADLTVDAGRMFARIKAAVARQESERKSARQTAAAKQRADKGRVPLGVRLTGYTAKGEVIEAEAVIVIEIFTRFYSGDSLKGIAKYLNERDVKTRHGGPWHSSSVRDILTNPRYAGRVYYNRRDFGTTGDWTPAASVPIIDGHIFDAVNARLADPRRKLNKTGTDRKYLGSSVYQCGDCQHPMRSHYLGGKPGYRCPNGHVNRTAAPIDEAVTALVRARLGKPDVAGLVRAPANEEVSGTAEELRRQRGRLNQVEQDYDSDLIDGKRYKEKRSKIEAEIAATEARLTVLTTGGEVAATLTAADPVEAYDMGSLGVKQAVIRFFMTVELLHVPQGRKRFDPETIRITPKHPVRPELHAAS